MDSKHSYEDRERTNDKRLPYSPPVILSREPLEAVAAVCVPNGANAKADMSCGSFRS